MSRQVEKSKGILKSKVVRFGKSFAEQYSLDTVTMMANGMVYSSLVAIVPCLSFIYTVLNWFGVLDPVVASLETFLVRTFGEVQGADLIGYLSVFTRNAMGMGIVSMLSFFVTFLLLADKLNTVINKIYHTDKAGNLATRFLRYAGTILIGLLGIAFILYFIGRFNSLALSGRLGLPELSRFEEVFQGVMPAIMTFALLLAMTILVPNCKVKMESALIGSAVGTVGVIILFKIFGLVVMRFVKYSIIYGSLATLLFFFLFLSFLWKIVFSAMVISYVHQSETYGVEYKL